MEVCAYVMKEDEYQTDFCQNLFWHEHETQHASAIILQ